MGQLLHEPTPGSGRIAQPPLCVGQEAEARVPNQEQEGLVFPEIEFLGEASSGYRVVIGLITMWIKLDQLMHCHKSK
jgi:hypothetical protein